MTFVSYSQNNEDVVLYRALKNVKNGFYIDVGAADPQNLSVTNAFYEMGWSGINVEPTARYYARLKAQRPRDTNLNALVGNTAGIVTFYELSSAGLSTTDSTIAQRHLEAGISHKTRSMTMLSLTSICQARGELPIHFLKIDVEGAERDVLLSMNFIAFRPWVVVIEATEPMAQVQTRDQWEDLILNHGYTFAYYDGLNCFYVANEHSALIEQLAVPPNVFDDFVKFENLKMHDQAEEWRQTLLKLGHDAEGWRLGLLAAKTRESELEADLARVKSELRNKNDRLVGGQTRLVEAEQQIRDLKVSLNAIEASTSWRVTAPLRGIASRHPGFIAAPLNFAAKFPATRHTTIWLLRNAWRAVTLRPLVARQHLTVSAPYTDLRKT